MEILHRVFDALFAGAVEHLHLSSDAVIQHIHIAEQVELLKDHADFGVVARHVDRAGEDILAVVKDLSLVRRFQQVDAAQQRRFARTGRADDAGHFALVGGKIHALEHFMVAKSFLDALNLNHAFHLLTASFSFSTDTLISARLSLCEPWMT